MNNIEKRLAKAVRHFWLTRKRQTIRQTRSGKSDQGSRGAVTGGAQLDGFITLIHDLLRESGLHETAIFRKQNIVLPGFFRPTKEWDLLVLVEGQRIRP